MKLVLSWREHASRRRVVFAPVPILLNRGSEKSSPTADVVSRRDTTDSNTDQGRVVGRIGAYRTCIFT